MQPSNTFRSKFLTLTACSTVFLLSLVAFRNNFIDSHVLTRYIIRSSQEQKYTDDVPQNDFDCVILFWTKFFGREPCTLYGIDRLFTDHPRCYDGCRVVTDRAFLNLSDAAVFNSRDLKGNDIPSHRPPSQLWIYFQLESPQNYKENLKPFGNMFNWTMTYRKDSDVYHPYYQIIPVTEASLSSIQFDGDPPKIDEEFHKQKTKSVAWIVSHCSTSSQREVIVDQLKKYIDVDVYGKCGNLTCPSGLQEMCMYEIGKSYKFYLSFENTLCADYVTEKFFRALQSFMIPIVYGGANYSSIAPNHSYINVDDFKSIKELADYLKFLETNPEKYLEYFWWVGKYKVSYSDGFCTLCKMLRARTNLVNKDPTLVLPEETNLVSSVYKDLSGWWNNYGTSLSLKQTAACKSPRAELLSQS